MAHIPRRHGAAVREREKYEGGRMMKQWQCFPTMEEAIYHRDLWIFKGMSEKNIKIEEIGANGFRLIYED